MRRKLRIAQKWKAFSKDCFLTAVVNVALHVVLVNNNCLSTIIVFLVLAYKKESKISLNLMGKFSTCFSKVLSDFVTIIHIVVMYFYKTTSGTEAKMET